MKIVKWLSLPQLILSLTHTYLDMKIFFEKTCLFKTIVTKNNCPTSQFYPLSKHVDKPAYGNHLNYSLKQFLFNFHLSIISGNLAATKTKNETLISFFDVLVGFEQFSAKKTTLTTTIHFTKQFAPLYVWKLEMTP